MNSELSKTEHLVGLLRKIASITHSGQPDPALSTPLHIHNSRNGGWDDIWLFLEGDTKARQPLIKVALIGLSTEERSQLDLTLHKAGGYTGRSEYIPTTGHKTALFKFVHKNAKKNIQSIEALQ